MIKYSASTNAFYDIEINKSIPEDAVEITRELHAQLLKNQSLGMAIIPGVDSYPINRSAAPSKFHLWENNRWVIDESRREELLRCCKDKIDAATDARILTGFHFSGRNFKLNIENQINFQTECSLRDMLTYPHRVKAIDGYFDFESAEQYRLFYLAGIAFIRQAVEAGWTQKDALNNLSTAELISAINEV